MTKTTLMGFPCSFPVKIIGTNTELFIEEIKQITARHFSDFKEEHVSHKTSKENNYLAMTVTVMALNQEALDAFYQEVTKHKQVKMVL